jgi:hypothetical protein
MTTATNNPFRSHIIEASDQGYIGQPRKTNPVRIARGLDHPAQAVRMITEGQRGFITSLFRDRDLTGELRPKFAQRIGYLADHADEINALSMDQASALIDCLMALPFKKGQSSKGQRFPGVPAGRYAVDFGDTLTFVRVSRPEEGRWAGYVFVDQQVSDEYVRIPGWMQNKLLQLIDEDPRAAAIRYGHEVGACAICGRTLTNESSRLAGIGPVCAAKEGW